MAQTEIGMHVTFLEYNVSSWRGINVIIAAHHIYDSELMFSCNQVIQ
jgi:hypothetical protein